MGVFRRRNLLVAVAASTFWGVVISLAILLPAVNHAGRDAAMGKTVEPVRFVATQTVAVPAASVVVSMGLG